MTSFAVRHDGRVLAVERGFGIYDAARRRVVLVAWRESDVQARLERHNADALLTLTYAPGRERQTWYSYADAASAAQAQAELRAFTNRR